MERREFLKRSGYYALTATSMSSLVSLALSSYAKATGLEVSSLEELRYGVPEAIVLVPTDPDYGVFFPVYSARYPTRPQIIVRCLTPENVAYCLNWAQRHQIAVHVRGGGNSFEGFSTGSGLVIDLSRLQSVQLEGETARIGAGARLGKVYQDLITQNFVLPAGSCPQVCVSGLTLGGGHGLLSRKWGLTCDHLLGARVVTADGRILWADESENPDLFWALRGGGGGNFGVVTEFLFKVRPALPVLIYRFTWTTAQGWQAFQNWQNFAPYASDNLSSIFKVTASGGSLKKISVMGQFVGSQSEFDEVTRDWLAALAPASRKLTPLANYLDSVKYFAGGDVGTSYQPLHFKASSDYVFEEKKITEVGFNALVSGLGATPTGGVAMFDAYGGAINRVPTSQTAFAHRVGALYSIQYYTQWETSTQTPARLEWMRNLREKMAPYVSGHCYVNYCDLQVQNPQRAYHGTNLSRLEEIKDRYDPKNIFKHAQSIEGRPSGFRSLDLVSPVASPLASPRVRFRLEDRILVADFEVPNPHPALKLGEADLVRPTEGLYKYEVVELFLSVNGLPEGGLSHSADTNRFGTQDEIFPYYEFELSPRNEFLEVKILSPKTAKGAARFDATFVSGFDHSAQIQSDRWIAQMRIPLDRLGWNGDPQRLVGNAFAVLGVPGQRSYWSLFLPRQAKPDFHKPRYFEKLLLP